MVDVPGSACTEMMSAPALAKSATRSSGSTIIRWQSSTLSVTGRSASTTRGPMVMFGTKAPIHHVDDPLRARFVHSLDLMMRS